jgi:putative ABC transport system permease protein
MAFPLHHGAFLDPEVRKLKHVLHRPDTAAVDRNTRPVFGAQDEGRIVEVGRRAVQLVGQYSIGTGFIELGTIIVSDQNFMRIFEGRSLDEVSFGLVKLRPGAEPRLEARKLRELLPHDVDVLTRDELMSAEQRYWVVNTSTGMIFGFGVLVAFLVGTVILYQTLSNQIIRQLPNLATMKAIGYTNRYLSMLIVENAVVLVVVGFVPGLIGAIVLYHMVSETVYLPVYMTWSRAVFVFVLAITMSVVSSLLSLRKLQHVDPADLM